MRQWHSPESFLEEIDSVTFGNAYMDHYNGCLNHSLHTDSLTGSCVHISDLVEKSIQLSIRYYMLNDIVRFISLLCRIVSIHSSVDTPYIQTFGLEDFDLAIGRVKKLGHVVTAVRVRVNLDAEGDALLSSVLLRRELGGEAVDLNEHAGLFRRIPQELHHVDVLRVLLRRHLFTKGKISKGGAGLGKMVYAFQTKPS